MRLNEFEDPNETEQDRQGIVLGHRVPDWFSDDDDVAIFSSTTGFNYAQVHKAPHGKFVVDFGKEEVREYPGAGYVETELRKRRLTRFEGIDQYRPSTY